MWHAVRISLRLVVLLVGLLFCYLGAFLYEKGRGRMRNRLEDWWIVLRRDSRFGASPHSSFMQSLAWSAMGRFLRRGLTPLSLESITLCVGLSLESCLLVWLILTVPRQVGMGWSNPLILVGIVADKNLRWEIPVAISPWYIAFVFVMLGTTLWNYSSAGVHRVQQIVKDLQTGKALSTLLSSLRSAVSGSTSKIGLKSLVTIFYKLTRLFLTLLLLIFFLLLPLALTLCLVAFIVLASVALYLLGSGREFELSLGWAALALFAAAATTVSFLALMQKILELCWRRSWSFKKTTLSMLSMCLLASLLFLGPLWFLNDGWFLFTRGAPMPSGNMTHAMARYFAFSNFIDVIVAFGFFAAALLLLAHRATWTHLKKSVIALRLAGVSLKNGWLLGTGITLLAVATGWLPVLIREFVAKPEIIKDVEDFFKNL